MSDLNYFLELSMISHSVFTDDLNIRQTSEVLRMLCSAILCSVRLPEGCRFFRSVEGAGAAHHADTCAGLVLPEYSFVFSAVSERFSLHFLLQPLSTSYFTAIEEFLEMLQSSN